jgi:hypothetical protein
MGGIEVVMVIVRTNVPSLLKTCITLSTIDYFKYEGRELH